MKKNLILSAAAALLSQWLPAQVLVEAESFTSKGDWVTDHQAFEKIYSGYLMGGSAGRKAADAVTECSFEKGGTYYAYVSTHNWTAPWYEGEGPGAFKLCVNGKDLPIILGTTGKEWNWQYAGKVRVRKGKVRLALKDLGGFNSRVDAIYFSKEQKAPESDYAVFSIERQKLLGHEKAIEHKGYDIVVAGGGIAGCTAALSAARYGLKVALVDNQKWLGGNAQMEVTIEGLAFKNLYPNLGYAACEIIGMKDGLKNDPEAYKVAKRGTGGPKDIAYKDYLFTDEVPDSLTSEILSAARRVKAEGIVPTDPAEIDLIRREKYRKNSALDRERILREAGVEIFHNIHIFEVRCDGGIIRSVTGRDLCSGEDHCFSAPTFIDCTGDGTVGYLAGADFTIGREGKDFANEPSAPEEADQKKMGTSMIWGAYEREKPGSFPKPEEIPWAFQLDKDYHINTNKWVWWWETGLEIDNAQEAELVRDNLLRAIYGNWAYLKNNDPKYASYRLDYVQHLGMKRESRRLIGDIMLTENDIAGHFLFPDASFTTTWTMDLHYAKKDNSARFPGWEWTTYCTNSNKSAYVGRYDVPYRCLYSRNIDNLFIGGRCMSVSHQALGTVRVQLTLGQASEVISMAAYLCKKHGCTPREIYTDHLDELKSLMRTGVPGKGKGKHFTILALGDSITQGGGNCTSYTYPLWKKLKEAGYDFEFIGPREREYDVGVIRHCGFGGKTVEYLNSKIDELYGDNPADIVLIHAGHNHFVEDNPVPGMIETHKSLINNILKKNPEAIIFDAKVINAGKLPKYSYIGEFNRQIDSLVRSFNSDRVRIADIEKGFDWETCTADDKVHPTEKGAEIMAESWFEAMQPILREL